MTEVPSIVKFTETESGMVVVWGWSGEVGKNGELLFTGYRVSVGKYEQLLEMDGSDGCTTMGTYLMPQSCTF